MTDKKAPTEREIMRALLAYTRSAAELANYMRNHTERFRGDWRGVQKKLNDAAVTVEGLIQATEEVTSEDEGEDPDQVSAGGHG